MVMNDEILKKLQDTELAIMRDLDNFLHEHDISYSLYAGTLIGAIRHNGFIPWDDDIDICMERKEYERFLDVWEETGGIDGYYLQSTRNLEQTNINFTKIRKDNTTFISKNDTSICEHNGIWVDIFPLDRVPKKKITRKLVKFYAMLWLVYTRNFPYTHGGKALRILTKILLAFPNGLKRKLQRYCERYITKYQNIEEGYDLIGLYGPQSLKRTFPGNIMNHTIYITFEDVQFKVVQDYDTMLRIQYGDYMQLPPEEKRVCGHCPQEISF